MALIRKCMQSLGWCSWIHGTKKIVHHWVRACAFELNGMPTSTHVNVLPLGSYSLLSGIDLFFTHNTKLD